MSIASNKRIERKNKIKRVFNYDSEMKYLYSYYDLKGKSMNVEDFIELARKSQLETEQVSEVVFDFFVDEIRIKQLIKDKKEELIQTDKKSLQLKSEIKELENSLKEEEDEVLSDDFYLLDEDCFDFDDIYDVYDNNLKSFTKNPFLI